MTPGERALLQAVLAKHAVQRAYVEWSLRHDIAHLLARRDRGFDCGWPELVLALPWPWDRAAYLGN